MCYKSTIYVYYTFPVITENRIINKIMQRRINLSVEIVDKTYSKATKTRLRGSTNKLLLNFNHVRLNCENHFFYRPSFFLSSCKYVRTRLRMMRDLTITNIEENYCVCICTHKYNLFDKHFKRHC